MATSQAQYENDVLKKLERFKNAKEWSDFLEPLDSLVSLFKNQRKGYIPCIPQLVKRLIQLLNPTLPGGIHMKTIECYHAIFDHIDQENLEKDFDALTIGLFSFSIHCRILVAGEYLNLLEKIILKLGPQVEFFSKNIILGILPFLESESSEFYNRAYLLLISFINQISQKSFYSALWRNFIDYPDLRVSIVNFMNSYKLVVITDYSLVTNALCAGLKSENPYIIRSILEISNRNFPYTIEITSEQQPPQESDSGPIIDSSIKESPVENVESTSKLGSPTSSPTITQPTESQKIKDLVASESGNPNENMLEKEKCNANLIHHILKIFLIKEVGINKRAYKWLNLSENIIEKDIDVIEKGLRTYLNGSDQDLLTFFRIVNSLADKENLIGPLIDRLVVDALRITMNIDQKKNIDSFLAIKKNVKTFLSHSLDDFYRSVYTKLAKIFENCSDLSDIYFDPKNDCDLMSSTSDAYALKSTASLHVKNSNAAEDLVRILIYCIDGLETVNTNASTIHIPLLCHLIVRNKKKISHRMFSCFMDIFCSQSERTRSSEAKEIDSSLIDTFYQKNNVSELLELSLIGSVAKELGRIEIYKESPIDCMLWSTSNLIEQNGVLIWSESNDLQSFIRNSGGFYNFDERDVELIQKYIDRFGFKDFNEEFLKIFAKYLCFNYKYIEMVRKLSFYIYKDLLYVNMWNDFIITKNPKFLLHYPEDELLPVIHTVFPTATLDDMCNFLSHTLVDGKFIDILFRVATLIDPNSSSFVSLILNLKDVMPLMNYIFEKFYSQSQNPYDFHITSAILYIMQSLIDCKAFYETGRANEVIHVEKFGEIRIMEAVSRMIISIITNEKINDGKIIGVRKKMQKSSAIINLNGHLIKNDDTTNVSQELSTLSIRDENSLDASLENFNKSVSSESDCSNDSVIDNRKSEFLFNNHPIVDYKVDVADSFCLIAKNSIHLIKETIFKTGFNCIYKINKMGLTISIIDIDNIKRVIKENRHDFYILKRSIFLVENDFDFIYKNYMHFYKLVLEEISEMPIKNNFFIFLASPASKCTVEVFLEAMPYFCKMPSFKMDELFSKAHHLMTERAKKGGILYKKSKGLYRQISYKKLFKSLNKTEPSAEESSIHDAIPFVIKPIYTEDEMADLLKTSETLPPLVMVKTDNLNPVLQLAEILYRTNPILFISTIEPSKESLYFFAILPFKLELLKKLLVLHRQIKFPIRTIHVYLQNIPYEERIALIKSEAEFIRSNFVLGEHSFDSQLFLLELFKNQQASDLSKMVFLHMLQAYESKIDQVLKLSVNFDSEIEILRKMVKISFKDTLVVNSYKNCCFNLLNSRAYRDLALQIIYSYLFKNPNCKIFIDQFVIYFNKNFFSFGLITKKKILELISNSSFFDPFLAIENAFSGMDSSFFMSAQSEELLKIQSLRKMAFLVLTQPKNKYSTMADNFVCLINSLINNSADIKYEVLRLCSILMFKIENNYLLTLYPILVADFMSSVKLKDIRVLGEIFKFVDLSIWMNSSVFDFKSLFMEDHHFRNKLLNELFTEEFKEYEVDFNTKKLPNFISSTIGKFSEWSHFSFYLNRMPSYYKYKENYMIENDVEKVEENLTLSFLELK